MSLIESAMARARTNAADAKAPPKSVAARAAPSPALPPAAPTERITAPFVRPRMASCQEYRVMVDEVATKNDGAVAAYRILRTRILQRARLRNWTTIGVTSASVSDGKSLTALNLSLSLARESNSEVILLDLDMRNPSVCRYLGVEPPRQLRDYFAGSVGAQDVFFTIGVENLFLAAGDVRATNASELLGNNRLDGLVQYIKQHTLSPIVLIDLPPLLNTDDALVVVPKIDATLLVVAEGHTDRAALNKAMELLSDVPLAGLVLNQSIESTHGEAYGYGVARD